jgi:hypothetical protein
MLSLDRTVGLVKGALATVVQLLQRTAVVRLAKPADANNALWALPRVCFEYESPKVPVKIVRRQLPLRLAWASTVHRVQGDDLERVVIDLRHPFFAHGQLYERDQMCFLVDEPDCHDGYFEAINVVVPQMLYRDDLVATRHHPPA